MHLLLINGPNLNLLGQREPDLYGASTLKEIEHSLQTKAKASGISLDCFQSNFEGALVDRVQNSISKIDGILINAGAYTHTSIALRDAFVASGIPFVELHLSNIHAREAFRQNSYLAQSAVGVVSGFGPDSYSLAFEGLVAYLRKH